VATTSSLQQPLDSTRASAGSSPVCPLCRVRPRVCWLNLAVESWVVHTRVTSVGLMKRMRSERP
jgi:hypothetical protein